MTRRRLLVPVGALVAVALLAGTLLLPRLPGDGPSTRPAVAAAALPEPTPYTVPTSPATDALPLADGSGVRPLRRGETSVPWHLIRLWDRGLAVQYGPGCADESRVLFEESGERVVVQVVAEVGVGGEVDRSCWTGARSIVPLTAPLGRRPLLHAPTSGRADDTRESLAQRFEDVPTWPGDPWFRQGREVTQDELSVAAGPEHCDWQEATYLGGDGLPAPRDERGRLWVRDPAGVLDHVPQARAGFRERATLPADAAPTGYEQGPVQVWVAPSDRWEFVYLVNRDDPTDVERWVRGGGGCA